MREQVPEWEDLAPDIYRQRLIIEGTCARAIEPGRIADYLTQLAKVCDMVPLIDPVTHRSDRYGWAGWVHWETSGAHFYAWDEPAPFFSVDIYTCKAFEPAAAIEFTQEFFQADRIVAKEF